MTNDRRFRGALGRTRRAITWTVVVGLAGLVLLAGAAIDLTFGDAGTQSTALVFAGVLMLLFPIIGDRLGALQLGPAGFRLELSRQFARAGATETARIVDRWATGLAEIAELYGNVRATADVGETEAERTIRVERQDSLVQAAIASARLYKYDRNELISAFHNGSPVVRVLIIGLMRGDTSLEDDGVILSAISESRSANEQYHALKLALELKPRMSEARIASVSAVIADDRFIWLAHGSDRAHEAREFLGADAGEATEPFS